MIEANGLQTGFADIEGARLYYEIAGAGPYLILAHAGIADRRMWDDQLPAFARRYRVVRYDMRGFGNSAMTPGPFSHRQDLYRLLKFLGIERTHLIGCSMGGLTAIDFSLEHSTMVGSLVLVSPAVSGYEFQSEPPQPVLELIAARRQRRLDRAAELQVQIWVDGPKRAAGQVNEHVREYVWQMSLTALSNQADFLLETGFVMEQPLEPPAMKRLEEIAVPVLIIIGDQDDDSIGAVADVLVTRLPGARKVVIAGAAHLPNMEKPAEFNQAVLSFLR